MENESGTKKLSLFWRISVVAFIAMFMLISVASNLTGKYGYSSWHVGMILPVAIISFIMPILTLVEISSLKKKNRGTSIGKTRGKKILSIVFLIFSFTLTFELIPSFMMGGSTETSNNRKTTYHSDRETATEDTVWRQSAVKDEFGDPIDGQYELAGLFQDDADGSVVVEVAYDDMLGPIIVLSIRNSVGRKEGFLAQPVELKMKVGSDVYQYRLFVADDKTTLYLMDYYSYKIQQHDAISEALTGGEKNISRFMEEFDEMTGGMINEVKSLYDVKSVISLLYNGQEDIRCVISNGINTYSFTIQPANFRNTFDNIWDYREVCAENDEPEKKYNEIINETEESTDDSQ